MKECSQTVGPADPSWEETLAGLVHDVYHLPAYTALEGRRVGGEPCCFLHRRGSYCFLAPYIRRSCADIPGATPAAAAFFDAISAYGYPAPLLSAAAREDSAFQVEAVQAWIAAMRAQGICSAFIRGHPLLSFPGPVWNDQGRLVTHGDVVVADLQPGEEELWHQTSTNHKRDIRRLQAEGAVVVQDDGGRHWPAFIAAYHATMQRVGAEEMYLFSADYFDGLRAALGDRMVLLVARIADDVAAAALFARVGRIAQYLLSGTRPEYLGRSPFKLVMHEARLWARRGGARWLNLGGGVGAAEDPLYRFKSGFGRARRPFQTWRCIVDPAACRALLALRGAGESALDDRGFFPPYRAPMQRT